MNVLERVLAKIRRQVSTDNMQFGFMPGKGTTYAIFIMRQVEEIHQSKKKKLYYAFVNLEKALNRVQREVVRWALGKLGVDEWFINTVMTLYTEACTFVHCCLLLSWMWSPVRLEVICLPSCCMLMA